MRFTIFALLALLTQTAFSQQTAFTNAAPFEDKDYRLKNVKLAPIEIDQAKNLPSKHAFTDFPTTAESKFLTPSVRIPRPLLQEMQSLNIDPKRAKVINFDLNGDGRLDAIILPREPRFCSDSGCTLLVFRNILNTNTGVIDFEQIMNQPNTREATMLYNEYNGWKILRINQSNSLLPIPSLVKEFVFDIYSKYYIGTEVFMEGEYTQVKNIEPQFIARQGAEQSITYQEDGKNLKLVKKSYIKDCSECQYYVFSMDKISDNLFVFFMHVGVERGTPFVMAVTRFPRKYPPRN